MEKNDSSRYYSTLHENAPHIFNEPDVLRFALLGKEGKFYMGIGANIKGVAVYDFGHPVSNPNDFAPSQIPMHIQPGNGAHFQISAQQSSVYLNVVALPGTKNQLGAFVSLNFRGDNYGPLLNHAYPVSSAPPSTARCAHMPTATPTAPIPGATTTNTASISSAISSTTSTP